MTIDHPISPRSVAEEKSKPKPIFKMNSKHKVRSVWLLASPPFLFNFCEAGEKGDLFRSHDA